MTPPAKAKRPRARPATRATGAARRGARPRPGRTGDEPRGWRLVAGLALAVEGVDVQVLPFYVRTTSPLRRALRAAAAAAGVSDHAIVERALLAALDVVGDGGGAMITRLTGAEEARRREGDREYVCIDVRAPRKKEFQGEGMTTSVTLDWLPEAGSGAYKAFSTLIEAQLSKVGLVEASQFYADLEAFCREYMERIKEEA